MAIPSKAASGIPQEHNPALIIATNLLVPSGNDEETSQAPIMGKQSRRLWTKLFESKETMRLFFGSLKGFLENPAMVETGEAVRAAAIVASLEKVQSAIKLLGAFLRQSCLRHLSI